MKPAPKKALIEAAKRHVKRHYPPSSIGWDGGNSIVERDFAAGWRAAERYHAAKQEKPNDQ